MQMRSRTAPAEEKPEACETVDEQNDQVNYPSHIRKFAKSHFSHLPNVVTFALMLFEATVVNSGSDEANESTHSGALGRANGNDTELLPEGGDDGILDRLHS